MKGERLEVQGLINNKEAPISTEQFINILPQVCDDKTSQSPDLWTQDNPLLGHCAVVSLVAQNLFGGDLLRASLEKYPDWSYARSHYVNILPNGKIIDFTKAQFKDNYPDDFEFEKRDRDYVLGYPETQRRFSLLSYRLAKELTQNPIFEDPIYERCFRTAVLSPCQKMSFGAVMVRNNEVVAESSNKYIDELRSMCDPTCIRLNITSRTESMLGACGHAEEWVLKETRDKNIDPKSCDLYVAGVDKNGMPRIKEEPEHTCLRCAVQMYYAQLKSIQIPVINKWMGITPSQALETSKQYATRVKSV
jgi:deoxycytidylate deaminase